MKTSCANSPLCEANQVCRCEEWEQYEAIKKMLHGIVTDPIEENGVIDCVINLVIPFIKQNYK